MKIRYEQSLPLATQYFGSLGQAEGYDVGSLTPEQLVDVDVLAVRSTTRVTPELLNCANRLTLVGTATAGINHLDTQYLDAQGIYWMSAAGCNAQAVAEYVLSALCNAHLEGITDLSTARVGIVGAGHVGTALSRLLDTLSISYVLYDPPLAEQGDERAFTDWQTILGCDVISLHVPFVPGGVYPTDKMIDAGALACLTNQQLLINACRGEVIDEVALKQRLQSGNGPTVVLDVFANEPAIDEDLLQYVWLATPHIAGHSLEGKYSGTQMVYEAICDLAGQTPDKTLDDFLPERPNLHVDLELCRDQGDNLAPAIALVLSVYDVKQDNNHFRQGLAGPTSFTAMRKQYRVRRELAGHTVELSPQTNTALAAQLTKLGFNLK